MVKKFEIVFIALCLTLLVIWVVIPLSPQFRSIALPQSLLHWWILFGWIFLNHLLGIKSKFTLIVAFILFLISALMTTIGLQTFAKIIMEISLIGWIIGFVQILMTKRAN